MRSLDIFTSALVSTDALRDFLHSLGGEDDLNTESTYFRCLVDGKEVATISVCLDTGVMPFYDSEDELEEFCNAMGGFPLSQIGVRIIGSGSRVPSTEFAYQMAEKIIAAWGGCIYAPGFTPSEEWKQKLSHLPWD